MNLQRVVVTGAAEFIRRYRKLFEALASRFDQLEFQPERSPRVVRRAIFKSHELAYAYLPSLLLRACDRWVITDPKDPRYFQRLSRTAERRLLARTPLPDLVIHVFGMFSPFWERVAMANVMMLDYTMALAERNYPPWAPFRDKHTRDAWLTCETRAYAGASHLFTFGPQTAESLVKDYGIEPRRVTVMRSSGPSAEPFDGRREFGTKLVLFNGSDFYRKGGDRVLAAFGLLRQRVPDARLVVVGKKLGLDRDGVENPGFIESADEMRRWFLQAELVVAPSRCEPYPGFLIEAMNYGVPCVTSAVDGIPDIVTHERSGLVLEKCEPAELAEALASLLTAPDRLRQMSAFARERVKQDLNWAAVAARVIDTLDSVLGKAGTAQEATRGEHGAQDGSASAYAGA